MSELRLDALSGDWVLVGCNPSLKVQDLCRRGSLPLRPDFLNSCPFCPGNEDLTPSELYALWDQRQNQWEIRVVPDKVPVLTREGVKEPIHHRLHRCVSGVGRHDVIVETPDHALSLHAFENAHLGELLRVYHACLGILSSDAHIEHVSIFRNHGPRSGSVNEHPHSQIVGMAVTPSHISRLLAEAAGYFNRSGQCLFCASLEQELEEEARIVAQSRNFVALEPFASFCPVLTHIYPRRHMASFGAITKQELDDLPLLLKQVLARLYFGFNDADYSLRICTAPKGHDEVHYFHWYIEIVPYLSPTTSFEHGSKVFLNPILPEDAAAFLRGITVEERQGEERATCQPI